MKFNWFSIIDLSVRSANLQLKLNLCIQEIFKQLGHALGCDRQRQAHEQRRAQRAERLLQENVGIPAQVGNRQATFAAWRCQLRSRWDLHREIGRFRRVLREERCTSFRGFMTYTITTYNCEIDDCFFSSYFVLLILCVGCAQVRLRSVKEGLFVECGARCSRTCRRRAGVAHDRIDDNDVLTEHQVALLKKRVGLSQT